MMTEEEKIAIERLTRQANGETIFSIFYDQEQMDKDIQTVLNLTEKQQKELELKDKVIDEIIKYTFNNFKAQLIIEYGIKNEEQFKKQVLNKVKGENEKWKN